MPKPRGSLSEQLGQILSDARERTGKSRRKFAAENDVSDVTLLEYERGRSNPTLAKVEELAEVYGVELAIVADDPDK